MMKYGKFVMRHSNRCNYFSNHLKLKLRYTNITNISNLSSIKFRSIQ